MVVQLQEALYTSDARATWQLPLRHAYFYYSFTYSMLLYLEGEAPRRSRGARPSGPNSPGSAGCLCACFVTRW